jgi:putative ABC transport system ATP-binding protein
MGAIIARLSVGRRLDPILNTMNIRLTPSSPSHPTQSPNAAGARTGSDEGRGIAIMAQSLSKRVRDADGELTILDAASFSARTGESIAVIGPSGSGKSTLLGLLAGLDQASSGRLELLGDDLSAMDEEARAHWRSRRVGFVFQSFQLLPNLTALENVLLPFELTGAADPLRRAQALLDRVGLANRAQHYPRTLSGGEQQRVALARAFALHPPLLFADEPTGSLDAATGERVIDLLFELNREHRATLVLVTHDERVASRCARRIAIEAGRITADSGTPPAGATDEPSESA